MKIREYQLDELNRARELQEEASNLHMIVPVLSWQYEIKDADGNVEERGFGKANSYTRNAINSIAWIAGLCSASLATQLYFQDGYVSARVTSENKFYPTLFTRTNESTNPFVVVGTSNAAESLDDYKLTASGLTNGVNSVNSVFNSISRKLITTLSRSFYNGTASDIVIQETGVIMAVATYSADILYIRDVITPVIVQPGKTLTWTYVTEVQYPA